jgi:hypothetical protein
MSYAHEILVPGAVGHNDPAALRELIEKMAAELEELPRLRQVEDLILDFADSTDLFLDDVFDLAKEHEAPGLMREALLLGEVLKEVKELCREN